MKKTDKLKIKSIKIENLFEIFNYTIEYPENENVLILTGANGFGKTQVLNILFHLFNKRFLFFYELVFDKITICLDNNISIEIKKVKQMLLPFNEQSKRHENDEVKIIFTFYNGNSKIDIFSYSHETLIDLIAKVLPFRKSFFGWKHHNTGDTFTINDIITKYGDDLLIGFDRKGSEIFAKNGSNILNSLDVHLIKEQRLFKKVKLNERNYRREAVSSKHTIMTNTIQTYSNELYNLISEQIEQSYTLTQTLDSSYPNRLVSEKNTISKEEYDLKFKELKEKQAKLIKHGLYENNPQKNLEYSPADKKALLVYLNDLEKKLAVFDDLLAKLELFTTILNERRFTYKSIKINKEKGFYFETSTGNELTLTQLSSGEQHEVVLLYELIFKTKEGNLVLIDEPEISLHITWQKEFIKDLLKIIKIQNFQVMIATHSPAIINDRWDLVYTLEKND